MAARAMRRGDLAENRVARIIRHRHHDTGDLRHGLEAVNHFRHGKLAVHGGEREILRSAPAPVMRLNQAYGPAGLHALPFRPRTKNSRPMPCDAQVAAKRRIRAGSWANRAVSKALRSLWQARPTSSLPT